MLNPKFRQFFDSLIERLVDLNDNHFKNFLMDIKFPITLENFNIY